ncbi:mPR-like GPCR protein [Xylariaceae sp. FL1019]|nr:mPR-like GPCR protein [Xylariaceae sp. FL1019]
MDHAAQMEVRLDPASSGRSSTCNEKQEGPYVASSNGVLEAGPERRSHTYLISYDELPAWHQDNPFIKHGWTELTCYGLLDRPISYSTKACIRSWRSMHNETLNIYTHLIPAIVALVVGETWVLSYLWRHYSEVAGSDYAIFAFLLSAAALCLGISSAYHTLMSHSRKVEARWLRLDFVGIIILILGSFISGIYVGFWCETMERKIYWSVSASLALTSIAIMLAPYFQGPKWRTFRLAVFVVTGLSGFAPIIHGIHMFGFQQMLKQSGLPYYFAEGGLFLLGAIAYATRFPECIKPGSFDIFGSSHQIFHVLVVIAAVVHVVGVLEAFDYNYHNRQCSY